MLLTFLCFISILFWLFLKKTETMYAVIGNWSGFILIGCPNNLIVISRWNQWVMLLWSYFCCHQLHVLSLQETQQPSQTFHLTHVNFYIEEALSIKEIRSGFIKWRYKIHFLADDNYRYFIKTFMLTFALLHCKWTSQFHNISWNSQCFWINRQHSNFIFHNLWYSFRWGFSSHIHDFLTILIYN